MTLRGKFQSYRHARRRRTWGAAAPRRTERGAVSVEAAITTPLLVALAFGIIEFGLLLKDDLGVTWQTVSVPIPTNYTCTTSVPTGCWVRLQYAYGSGNQPSGATSWTAGIEGDPVRLVE